MSEFSDQYFHDLAPRQRRYDTPVSDQLHFCVFPNGVKSWVFLYEVDGHLRRRTIGLFPDMGYQAALRALDPNRKIAAVDASEQRQPAGRPAISLTLTLPPVVQRFLRRISLTDVLTAAGTAIVALAVLMYFGGSDDPPPAEPPPAPVARTEPPPAQPAPTAAPDAGVQLTAAPPAEVATPVEPEPAMPSTDDPARGTIRMAAPAEPDPAVSAFEEDPGAVPADGDETTDADVEAELAAIGPVEELDNEQLEAMGATGTAAAVWADEAALQEQLLAAQAEQERQLAAADPTANPFDPAAGGEGAATAGPDDSESAPDGAATGEPSSGQEAGELTVRRALLAGDVIDGQPRDTLSGTVTVPAGGELLIYFYLEFAGGLAQPVTHRWMNGGNVEEESAMQVDADGGTRVYTARLIGADRAGEWRVEAVAADGRLLRGLDFTVVAADEETPAATLVDEPQEEPES